MNPDFEEYFKSIGMESVFINIAGQLLAKCKAVLGEEASSCFISTKKRDDGGIAYSSFVALTSNCYLEAREFVHRDDFSLIPYGFISRLFVKSNDYDYVNAADTSVMTVNIRVDNDWVAQFEASGKNCDRLRSMVADYLRPNLAPRGRPM